MREHTIQVGLIGAGRIGRLHARNLCHHLPRANLTKVTDIAEPAAKDCAQRFRIPHASSDYHDILRDPDIRAIVICSPTNTHAQIIEEAARAGKHVFCEKPIDFDLNRIDRALASVEDAGVILQVGFNRRFDANSLRVRQAIRDHEIGEPHQLHIVSRDPAPPPIEYVRDSGGIFLDMTIHDFDMARFLIGSDAREIYAVGSAMIDPAIEAAGDVDTATVVLKFVNGVTGVIENSRQAVYGYDQRVEVFGSRGRVNLDNVSSNSVRIQDGNSCRSGLPLDSFLERFDASYIEEMAQFLQAIESRGPSPVTGIESRIPVVMGIAALKSCRENRPVRIDEIT